MYYVVPYDSELYHYGVLGMKCGVTVANFPLVGRWYTGNYTFKRDTEERLRALDEESKRKH